MRFSRIWLENWRNFSEVDVALQNRAFIIGANASGKSNFLDVFRFLHDLVANGFQKAVESRGGVSHIRRLPAADVIIEVELSQDDTVTWRYRIVFSGNNRPLLKEEKIWRDDQPVLNRPDEDDVQDKERLSQTYLEQTFANREFREITGFFKSITYAHITPEFVRQPDFLEQVMGDHARETRLSRIESVLKLAIPHFSKLEVLRDAKGVPHLRALYGDSWQEETEFSDGTLRLVGMLWMVQEGEGTLLLEEPELSLHPAVVRQLPQIMRSSRQMMITTHSGDLLQDPGIGLDEILLLKPEKDGTKIETGLDRVEIRHELEAGLNLAEIVLPRTNPPLVHHFPSIE